jgi:hypothetical protein
VRKILATLGGGVLALAGALVAVPAQAVVVPDDLGFIDKQTCEDDGGVPYKVKVDWNYKYVDPAGTTRVSVNPLVIKRSDADAGPAADAGVDLVYRVYSHGTTLIQSQSFDGFDLDFGVDDQASFNPRNPVSDAGDTKITVIVGTDGDGLGNCPLLTFVQPVGIQFRPPAP